ncbi:MAG: NUDIX hydrolase [Chitinophagales bacterium]|jgi:ADP-ribose pyrophosphatase YjhB (NUDIX family)|nr:NUDIX hydrolase [Chitinophagales bacterium]
MYQHQKYCNQCGKEVVFIFTEGKDRFVCEHCNIIHYTNPKIVVGAMSFWENKILLCKRAIEPRKGFWNLPAGYLEDFEKAEDGAIRETMEEAGAAIEIIQPFVVYNIPQANQVYIHFLAKLIDGTITNGVESLETKLFTEEEIPWKEMAFTSSTFTIKKYFEDRKSGNFKTYLASFPEV